MKTKFFAFFVTCFITIGAFAQTNLNSYKYVIVPNKFDFLKEKDQYQLNSLTNFLFNKYGFEALMEGESYPEDLAKNRCLALRSDVIKDSGMFKTKLSIEIKDCNDQVVFTSEVGESREKEYKTAYNQALREAFKSIEALNYKYKPSDKVTSLEVKETPAKNEVAQEIQQLKQEIQNLKKEKEAEVVEVEKTAVRTPVVKSEPRPIEDVETIQEGVEQVLSSVLYAQEIQNGFQLVDSSPKVVYRIKQTGANNVFIVENKSAIIYKKGDSWVLEYYLNDTLQQESLNIKF